jgi:uroporphyrinogen-III decarboxylase
MDLRLDKADLLARVGILDEDQADRFHFDGPPDAETLRALHRAEGPLCAGSVARDEALRVVAREGDLVPMGMAIGPFSLATKLMADPITAAAMLGSGVARDEDPGVSLLCHALEMAEGVITASVHRQVEAGARAMLICEPTASLSYLSPRQIRAGSHIFENLVLKPNGRIKAILDRANVAFFFHDCGELTPEMVREFGHFLRPAVLSLGSSRVLWEDAKLVPDEVVLYGNLPSKSFYSDADLPVEEVRRRTTELIGAMKSCGHAHITGTECDVLHVPGAADTIRAKVDAMVAAPSPS